MAKKTTKNVQSPLRVGNAVIIRTVTLYHTGRIVALTKEEIVLVDAAWIADTGRWHEALKTGKLIEVEPFPGPVSVNRGAVIDVADWTQALPLDVR